LSTMLSAKLLSGSLSLASKFEDREAIWQRKQLFASKPR
jgi:hypothetical protein